jgi:ribonuclease HI
MTETVIIYTDGACRGNPGPGGWGAILNYKGKTKELYGGERETTNNRMELLAAIHGLEALKKKCKVEINTDSKYVMQGITEWMSNWKKRGWKTAGNKPVKNEDLWRRLDAAIIGHDVKWKWVKGHSGNNGNDRADALANLGIDTLALRSEGKAEDIEI